MAEFVVGFVVGAALMGILVIVIGPTRRVRAETGIDDEVETRILLGIDPEPQVASVVEITHPREYSNDDLAELESLSKAPQARTAKKRKR